MNYQFYYADSGCPLAQEVYGNRTESLSEEKLDHLAEFCTLAGGVGCRTQEDLTIKFAKAKKLVGAA